MKSLLVLLMILLLISGIYAQCNENQININTASKEELKEITQIGPSTAQEIINYRNNKTFDSVDELINVKYIGNWTLNKIKEQGLACVEQVKNETEQNNETQKSKDIKEEILPQISETELNIKKPITFDTINLNPKTIKSSNGEEKSEKSNSNYAIYGFIAFCILIAVLFLLKIRKRKFSEFK